MYASMYLWEDGIDITIVNEKYENIGNGGITLL